MTILADYRVKCRYGTDPKDSVDDAIEVFHWISGHAKKLRIQLGKVVAAGGSAGGHLALEASLKLAGSTSRPAALLLFNPVADLRLSGMDRFTTTMNGTARKNLSPTFGNLTDLAPMLIQHGDQTVPLDSVKNFCDRVNIAKIKREIDTCLGADHGFFNPVSTNKISKSLHFYFESIENAERFLKSIKIAPAGD